MKTLSSVGLFPTGKIVATPGALALLSKETLEQKGPFLHILIRHVSGDWGNICDDDKELNDHAIDDGDRIMSAYTIEDAATRTEKTKVWIITEADRSSTTILLPEEY
jgi:hypothetical protein